MAFQREDKICGQLTSFHTALHVLLASPSKPFLCWQLLGVHACTLECGRCPEPRAWSTQECPDACLPAYILGCHTAGMQPPCPLLSLAPVC